MLYLYYNLKNKKVKSKLNIDEYIFKYIKIYYNAIKIK